LLTIEIENSSLGDILDAVRSRVGVMIEFPATAASERATVKLGPASPSRVLADLLLGSPFDYLIVGSAQEPGGLRVALFEKKMQGDLSALAVADAPPSAAATAPLFSDARLRSDSQSPSNDTQELAVTGVVVNAPPEDWGPAPEDGGFPSDAMPRKARPSKENPRYFPPLKKQ
jgi:hypothetical protein